MKKIVFRDMTEENYLVSSQGKSFKDAKLAFWADDEEEGEEIKKVSIRYTRGFSVGYSADETQRLEEKYEIKDTYDIWEDAIIKKSTGTNFTMGAYSGYYRDGISINGIYCAGGWGEADQKDEIINAVLAEYDKQ